MKFWIENPKGDDEKVTLFVDEKSVGTFTHEEHGWAGMKYATSLFERVAEAVGAEFERRIN